MDGLPRKFRFLHAGHDQNAYIGALLLDLPGKFMALHAGHKNICDQQMYVSRVLRRKFQRLLTVDSFEETIAIWLESINRGTPNGRVILCHENTFFAHFTSLTRRRREFGFR